MNILIKLLPPASTAISATSAETVAPVHDRLLFPATIIEHAFCPPQGIGHGHCAIHASCAALALV
ncbi:MAG: hypothetical protein AAB150_10840 [Pseudomonadota bacterium]